MKRLLQLEEIGMLLAGIFVFSTLNLEWWWFVILFFTPDIGMLGYLFGNKTGAISYNLFHHKGVAVLLFLTGAYLQVETLQVAGTIIFAHSAFDRLLGYGLKYEKGFKFTPLGIIGGANDVTREVKKN